MIPDHTYLQQHSCLHDYARSHSDYRVTYCCVNGLAKNIKESTIVRALRHVVTEKTKTGAEHILFCNIQ